MRVNSYLLLNYFYNIKFYCYSTDDLKYILPIINIKILIIHYKLVPH